METQRWKEMYNFGQSILFALLVWHVCTVKIEFRGSGMWKNIRHKDTSLFHWFGWKFFLNCFIPLAIMKKKKRKYVYKRTLLKRNKMNEKGRWETEKEWNEWCENKCCERITIYISLLQTDVMTEPKISLDLLEFVAYARFILHRPFLLVHVIYQIFEEKLMI